MFSISSKISKNKNPFVISLKKLFIGILCNSFSGNVVSLLMKNKIPNQGCTISTKYKFISSSLKMRLLLGLYEIPEISFIKRYLYDDIDIVELGSSIGVLSSHIIQKLSSSARLICVEANPLLIQCLSENLHLNSHSDNYYIKNCMVTYESEDVRSEFQVCDNFLSSKIGSQSESSNIKVDSVTLKDIINEFQIKQYSLVCDIEGAEKFIFENESESLKNCIQIIIELHNSEINGVSVKMQDVRDLIVGKHRFYELDSHISRETSVHVFKRL